FEKPQKGCFLLCGLLGLITLLILEKLSEIGSADLYLWLTNLPLFPGLSKAIESELLSTLWVWDKSESTLILSHFLLSSGLYAGISLYSLIFSGLIKKLS
ncbi:hypothetical protein, partial [Cyanothece sp. BG0011]|uniref:hypothetical protein n=1 Tax=Cyanothece sp. BG0011 TaxID=2082950 RepID=UPI001E4A3E20